MKSGFGWTLLLLSLAGVCAHAGEPPVPAAQPEGAPPQSGTAAPTGGLVQVPALCPVKLALGDTIASNVNKPGDRFKLIVAEDVTVGDVVVIPAGTTGEGEVIHAAKSGAGGKAGELLLAARFLNVGEQTVRLRSFAIGGAGADRSGQALATSFVVGPFAMFVRGGVIVIPKDTVGTAKTLETVQLPATQPGPTELPSPPVPAAEPKVPEPAPEPSPETQPPPDSGTGA